MGGLFPKETEDEIVELSKGAVQNAANALQWNLVEGLDQVLEEPVHILNALYIGSYPKRYKQIMVPAYEFHHTSGANDFNVPFCNLMGWKQISRVRNIKKYIKKWALKDENKPKVILAYALTSNNVSAILYAKKINPNISAFIVVPDLPQYMNTSNRTTILYQITKGVEIKYIKKNLGNIDGYVLLTEYMNEFIQTDHYVVVEGVASDSFDKIKQTHSEIKTIVYTGTLHARYGVRNLVDAFMKIKSEDVKLIICGSGDSSDYIRTMQQKDRRIDFRGSVTREEALEIQANATVLVNPRMNNEEFTKYSFPSKNMEYMSSGVPVVAYKLDGIPDEYDDYIIYAKDNTVDGLLSAINTVCQMTDKEHLEFGKKAKDFVLKNKNKKQQANKIIDLVNLTIK